MDITRSSKSCSQATGMKVEFFRVWVTAGVPANYFGGMAEYPWGTEFKSTRFFCNPKSLGFDIECS
jgi:hypothetical protein